MLHVILSSGFDLFFVFFSLLSSFIDLCCFPFDFEVYVGFVVCFGCLCDDFSLDGI